MKMKPVLHTIDEGGSGTGFSYWSNWAKCPKRAALDEEAAQNGEHTSGSSAATRVGRIAHAYMAFHFSHGKAFKLSSVRFSDLPREEDRIEAERVFRAYQGAFPMGKEFGSIVAVESPIEGTEAVTSAVGISPYTARLDLVTRLTAKTIKGLLNSKQHDFVVGAEYLTPGIAIVDHKFLSQKSATLVESYQSSHQATSYHLAWDAMHPKLQASCFIFNIIFKKTAPSFGLIILPAPHPGKVKALHAFYKGAKLLRDHPELRTWANSSVENCFSYNKMCYWRYQQICAGY